MRVEVARKGRWAKERKERDKNKGKEKALSCGETVIALYHFEIAPLAHSFSFVHS